MKQLLTRYTSSYEPGGRSFDSFRVRHFYYMVSVGYVTVSLTEISAPSCFVLTGNQILIVTRIVLVDKSAS